MSSMMSKTGSSTPFIDLYREFKENPNVVVEYNIFHGNPMLRGGKCRSRKDASGAHKMSELLANSRRLQSSISEVKILRSFAGDRDRWFSLSF
jgi:hypothetical protein